MSAFITSSAVIRVLGSRGSPLLVIFSTRVFTHTTGQPSALFLHGKICIAPQGTECTAATSREPGKSDLMTG